MHSTTLDFRFSGGDFNMVVAQPTFKAHMACIELQIFKKFEYRCIKTRFQSKRVRIVESH